MSIDYKEEARIFCWLPEDHEFRAVCEKYYLSRGRAMFLNVMATVDEKMNPPETVVAGVHFVIESHDMGGARESIPASTGEGDGVQAGDESHEGCGPAPSTQSEEEAIHFNYESHNTVGPSSLPPDRNGGVLGESESHRSPGASIPTPDRSGEIHNPDESLRPRGLSAAPPPSRSVIQNQAPTPERMRAMREAGHSSVPTIFERFKLPDGRRYADVRPHEYVGLAGIYLRHSSLLLKLNKLAIQRGKMGPRFSTRDVLTVKEFEREIATSGLLKIENEIKEGILIQPDGEMSFVRKAPTRPEDTRHDH